MSKIDNVKALEYLDYSSIDNIEALANGIMNETRRAIIDNRFDSILVEIKKLQSQFERIRNKLDLDNDINRRIYCFGKISSATQLAVDIARSVEHSVSFEKVAKSYPQMRPILLTIADYSEISGADLRKILNLSSGSLSNFMKRIDGFHLVVVHKIGRDNYYSLTPEGKKAISREGNIGKRLNEAVLPITVVKETLTAVAEELKKDKPNAAYIVSTTLGSDVPGEEKIQIKAKINEIFSSGLANEKNRTSWGQLYFSHKENYNDDSYQSLFYTSKLGNI